LLQLIGIQSRVGGQSTTLLYFEVSEFQRFKVSKTNAGDFALTLCNVETLKPASPCSFNAK
jgi:hypothetical protein